MGTFLRLTFTTLVCFLLGRLNANVDDFENFINPEDLDYFSSATREGIFDDSTNGGGSGLGNRMFPEQNVAEVDPDEDPDSKEVDCFGVGGFMSKLRWLFDLKPLPSSEINTKFYLTTRRNRNRVEMPSKDQFNVRGLDFNPRRRTIIIVHGFMSYSNASWVLDLTSAFLNWNDANVITVDWSQGGNTWKYWRAVANARTVGNDLTNFLVKLRDSTRCLTENFHLVGHSLGAHICSFAAAKLGGVKRITGLDPAQPCFRTKNKAMLLDTSDAEYVDIIHTNGRLLSRIGFGLPDPIGHADFYPNGGMKQPGCYNKEGKSLLQKILPISTDAISQAICSHGRSYLLFTESLMNKNCSFIGPKWNLSYEGLNSTINTRCDNRSAKNCGYMGIEAYGGYRHRKSLGQFFIETRDSEPFCTVEPVPMETLNFLLSDLKGLFEINKLNMKQHPLSKKQNNFFN